jgi:putative transposase
LSYETIRAWCDRFGPEYANQLRRRGRRLGDNWHLDEVFVQITAHSGTCGARSTSTATCSTLWSGRAEPRVAAKKFFRRLRTGLR